MNRWKEPSVAVLVLAFVLAWPALGQKFEANYDEDKVPEYTLPDPVEKLLGDDLAFAKDLFV